MQKSIKEKMESDLQYYDLILDEMERLQFKPFEIDEEEPMLTLKHHRDLLRKLHHVLSELLDLESSNPNQ